MPRYDSLLTQNDEAKNMIRLCFWGMLFLIGSACGASASSGAEQSIQERQCLTLGWTRQTIHVDGLQRSVLWKAPAGVWNRGAIVVLHGGGGQAANFCVANSPIIEAQVRFTTLALAQGFAVFLADSLDQVTDNEGRLCGKVWDDEVRERSNLDLPFLQHLLTKAIPTLRPPASRTEIFMVGHSSGGYMTVRAATKFSDHVTAFAPVSSGDPYGWTRDCTPRRTDRVNVFGAGFDNETGRQITERGACSASDHRKEKPWDGTMLTTRPAWKAFHHKKDSINDVSCLEKLRKELVMRGYPETPPLLLNGGWRSARWHYWLDDYNEPLVEFFIEQLR